MNYNMKILTKLHGSKGGDSDSLPTKLHGGEGVGMAW